MHGLLAACAVAMVKRAETAERTIVTQAHELSVRGAARRHASTAQAALADAVAERVSARLPRVMAVPPRRFLTTDEASAYCGYSTASGIKNAEDRGLVRAAGRRRRCWGQDLGRSGTRSLHARAGEGRWASDGSAVGITGSIRLRRCRGSGSDGTGASSFAAECATRGPASGWTSFERCRALQRRRPPSRGWRARRRRSPPAGARSRRRSRSFTSTPPRSCGREDHER